MPPSAGDVEVDGMGDDGSLPDSGVRERLVRPLLVPGSGLFKDSVPVTRGPRPGSPVALAAAPIAWARALKSNNSLAGCWPGGNTGIPWDGNGR